MVRLLKEKLDDLRESVSRGVATAADDDDVLRDLVEEAAARRCPYCEEPVVSASIICIHCGFNAETRDFVRTRVEGLRLTSDFEDRSGRRRERARATASAMLAPVMLLAFGLLTRAVAGATLFDLPAAVNPLYLGGLAIATLIGVTALWVIARVWFRGLGPVHLAVVRLAAAYAVVDALMLFVAPILLIGLTIAALVHIILVSRLFEMELQDALVVGALTLLLKICVFLAMGVPWVL
jgi:hypothetical protein